MVIFCSRGSTPRYSYNHNLILTLRVSSKMKVAKIKKNVTLISKVSQDQVGLKAPNYLSIELRRQCKIDMLIDRKKFLNLH